MPFQTAQHPHTADILSEFNGTPAVSNVAPFTPPTAPAPGTYDFNPSDPAIARAMAHAREQERNLRIRDADEAKAEAKRLASELEAIKAKQQAEADAAAAKARAALSGDERTLAEVRALQEQIALLQKTNEAVAAEATNQVQAWKQEMDRKEVLAAQQRIIAEHGGKIDPASLDTSSMQALQSSIPRALDAYQQLRNHFLQEFRSSTQTGAAAVLQQLPGYPSQTGLPQANNAGSVMDQGQSGQSPQFVHPALDGGRSFAAVREQLHGRVQTVMPHNVQGQQYFQGQQYGQQPSMVMPAYQVYQPVTQPYPAPQQPVMPQPYGSQAYGMQQQYPQYAAQQAYQYQPQVPTNPQTGAPLTPGQLLMAQGQAQQQQFAQPQPQNYGPVDQSSMRSAAADAVARHRGTTGASGANLRTSTALRNDAMSGGARGQDPMTQPIQGYMSFAQHPMAAPRAGSV